MAENKVKKVFGKQWKKGESGNPKGRPKVPKEVKAIREINQYTLTELLNKYVGASIQDLDRVAKDKETPAIDLIVISAIKYSIQKGDANSRNFLIERLVGKIPDKIQVAGVFGHKNLVDELEDE